MDSNRKFRFVGGLLSVLTFVALIMVYLSLQERSADRVRSGASRDVQRYQRAIATMCRRLEAPPSDEVIRRLADSIRHERLLNEASAADDSQEVHRLQNLRLNGLAPDEPMRAFRQVRELLSERDQALWDSGIERWMSSSNPELRRLAGESVPRLDLRENTDVRTDHETP